MSFLTMIKIGADGKPLPEGAADAHAAVLLPQVGLMFTATNVASNVSQKKCIAAAKACRVAGFNDWELPTSSQLMLLVDHSRRQPAIDTDFFRDIASDWYWTSTPWIDSDGKASASIAWFVNFSLGLVSYGHRYGVGFALAVRRSGQ